MKFKNILPVQFAFIAFVLLMPQYALGSSILPHRFHTTLTRIDYNAEQKLFEVSIQLFTHDLVPLLEKRTGGSIDLEKTKDIDKHILNYLNETFVLADKKGTAKKFVWVGKEFDNDSIRVYLEVASTESIEGYQLQNTILFESFREQTNLVICRFDNKKANLMFKNGDLVKEIRANQRKKEN